MNTASLLVAQLARLDRRVLSLLALVTVGLGLLCVVVIVPGLPVDAGADDPLLGPFRWVPMARGLA